MGCILLASRAQWKAKNPQLKFCVANLSDNETTSMSGVLSNLLRISLTNVINQMIYNKPVCGGSHMQSSTRGIKMPILWSWMKAFITMIKGRNQWITDVTDRWIKHSGWSAEDTPAVLHQPFSSLLSDAEPFVTSFSTGSGAILGSLSKRYLWLDSQVNEGGSWTAKRQQGVPGDRNV